MAIIFAPFSLNAKRRILLIDESWNQAKRLMPDFQIGTQIVQAMITKCPQLLDQLGRYEARENGQNSGISTTDEFGEDAYVGIRGRQTQSEKVIRSKQSDGTKKRQFILEALRKEKMAQRVGESRENEQTNQKTSELLTVNHEDACQNEVSQQLLSINEIMEVGLGHKSNSFDAGDNNKKPKRQLQPSTSICPAVAINDILRVDKNGKQVHNECLLLRESATSRNRYNADIKRPRDIRQLLPLNPEAFLSEIGEVVDNLSPVSADDDRQPLLVTSASSMEIPSANIRKIANISRGSFDDALAIVADERREISLKPLNVEKRASSTHSLFVSKKLLGTEDDMELMMNMDYVVENERGQNKSRHAGRIATFTKALKYNNRVAQQQQRRKEMRMNASLVALPQKAEEDVQLLQNGSSLNSSNSSRYVSALELSAQSVGPGVNIKVAAISEKLSPSRAVNGLRRCLCQTFGNATSFAQQLSSSRQVAGDGDNNNNNKRHKSEQSVLPLYYPALVAAKRLRLLQHATIDLAGVTVNTAPSVSTDAVSQNATANRLVELKTLEPRLLAIAERIQTFIEEIIEMWKCNESEEVFACFLPLNLNVI